MKIPVNKNIDVYKDDFFKGLSMRECLCAFLTLVSGTAVFFLSDSLLRLPQEVSLYCALPVSFLCAASGFLKISGMPPLVWMRKRAACIRTPFYVYAAAVTEKKLLEDEETCS